MAGVAKFTLPPTSDPSKKYLLPFPSPFILIGDLISPTEPPLLSPFLCALGLCPGILNASHTNPYTFRYY